MCKPYKPSDINYILPQILPYANKLCSSYDRTHLTIVTFVRLIIYVFIYYIINKYVGSVIKAEQDNSVKKAYKYFDYAMIFILFSNLACLVIVLSKIPKHKQNEL